MSVIAKSKCDCPSPKEMKKTLNEGSCKIENNDEFVEKQKKRHKKTQEHNEQEKSKPKKKRHLKTEYKIRNKTWKDESCKKLLIDYEGNPVDAINRVEKLTEKIWDDFFHYLKNKGIDVGGKKIGIFKCIYESGGNPISIVKCIWNFLPVSNIPDAYEIIKKALALYGNVDVWSEVGKNLEEIEKYKNCTQKGMSAAECKEKLKEAKDRIFQEAVEGNTCLKARRCLLQPYKPEVDKEKALESTEKNKMSPKDEVFKLNNKSGCCPGQRAHHVVPQTKFDRKVTPKELENDDYNSDTTCDNYSKQMHDNAPTVCVEGGHSSGTHGKMHEKTDKQTRNDVDSNEPHTLEQTLTQSAKAFKETFKNCDEACIKAQLDSYYNHKGLEACLKERGPRNKIGKPIKKKDEVIREDEV